MPLEQSARDADKALRDFFKGLTGSRKNKVNPPRLKRKSDKQSAGFTRNSFPRETTGQHRLFDILPTAKAVGPSRLYGATVPW